MPIILLNLLRPFVMWVVQVGVTAAASSIIVYFLQKIVALVAEHYGIPEDDAKIVTVNYIIDVAAVLGTGTATIYLKLPTKAAQYLGLTSERFTKKAVSKAAAEKITAADKAVDAEAKAQKLASSIAVGDKLWKGVLIVMLLQQVGDWFIFGKPQLQSYLNAIFGKDTIKLPSAKDAPAGFSNGEWDTFTTGIEKAGVVGINNIATKQSQVYSRDQLAILMSWLYGEQVRQGLSTTPTALQKAVHGYLIFSTPTAQTPAAGVVAAPAPASGSSVKVFTGIVSQGVLGSGATFTPRPDDLITDTNDLKQAMENNLAPFLAALPSKIVYTVQIVPSVTTKDGFTQRGSVNKIQVGVHANKTPKYKTVVNKFAVLDIFIMNEKNNKTKITRIVLGPTDAIHFQPTTGDLGTLETQVKQDLHISNPAQITGVQIAGQTTTVAPVTQLQQGGVVSSGIPTTTREKMTRYGVTLYQSGGKILYYERGGFGFVAGMGEILQPERIQNTLGLTTNDLLPLPATDQEGLVRAGLVGVATSKSNLTPEQFAAHLNQYVANEFGVGAAPVVSSGTNPMQNAGGEATTLFEWYTAQSKALPSIAERSTLYEQMGLGPAGFYTGTAEQNTKLLLKLQGK